MLKRLDTRPFVIAGALCASLLPAGASAADYVAKIGHLESPQQTRNVMLEHVAELVNERTDGAVEFQIFPQGQLGSQREMNEGVQMGTIEATVSPAAFLGGFNPAVSILDIPYLLPEDDKQHQELIEGKFGEALCDSFASYGVTCLGLWPNGKKDFTSNEPISTIADFAGQKFRVMDSKILVDQFKAIDASATPIAFAELYTALQTGVVDGEENPLDTIQSMKYFEVQKNLLVSNHGAMEDVILFNPAFWDSLPENYQSVITETFREVVPELMEKKKAAIASALEAVTEAGMNVEVASDAMKAEFREIMYPVTKEAYLERAGDVGQSLIDVYESEYAAVTGQ